MLELIGFIVVVQWIFSSPYIIGGIVAAIAIGFIGVLCTEGEEQPLNKELRGMTREQRRQWANREGPYRNT